MTNLVKKYTLIIAGIIFLLIIVWGLNMPQEYKVESKKVVISPNSKLIASTEIRVYGGSLSSLPRTEVWLESGEGNILVFAIATDYDVILKTVWLNDKHLVIDYSSEASVEVKEIKAKEVTIGYNIIN